MTNELPHEKIGEFAVLFFAASIVNLPYPRNVYIGQGFGWILILFQLYLLSQGK